MIGFYDIEELKKKTEIFFVFDRRTNKFAKKDIVYIKKHETYGIVIKEPISQDGFYQVTAIVKHENGNVEYPYLLLDEKEIELADLNDGSFVITKNNKLTLYTHEASPSICPAWTLYYHEKLMHDKKTIIQGNRVTSYNIKSAKQLAFIFSTKNKEEFNKYWKRHGFKSKTFKIGDKVTKFDIHLAASQAAAINAMGKM